MDKFFVVEVFLREIRLVYVTEPSNSNLDLFQIVQNLWIEVILKKTEELDPFDKVGFTFDPNIVLGVTNG